MAWETVSTHTVGAVDSGVWSDFNITYDDKTKSIGYNVSFLPGGSSSGGWYIAENFSSYRYRVISQSFPEKFLVLEKEPTKGHVGTIDNSNRKLGNKQGFLIQRELKSLPNGKIKEQERGTNILFGGSWWTILEPTTGLMFKLSSLGNMAFDRDSKIIFDTSDVNNIGYYLNTTYLNTLTQSERNAIKLSSWGIGLVGPSDAYNSDKGREAKSKEDTRTVPAKVCLLSLSEWYTYSKSKGLDGYKILDRPVYLSYMRLRTPADGYSKNVTVVNDTGAIHYTLNASGPYQINPVLCIDEELTLVNGEVTYNAAPTVTLKTGNNLTLYENDTINITGIAYDPDADQSVTAYYQINNEPWKVLATNLSQTQIPLSKQLTFKGGKLYDGETAITGILADGVAHGLKVWAVDSESAQSAVESRTFYVVPNRAPLLSVDTVIPDGTINTDKFTISGNASDQDANANVTVKRRINAGDAIEIYNGPGGAWEFDVSLAQLTVGQNTIIIEVIDNYGAKTSKTIKLNKNEVKTPILQSVARYKIEPPKGSAKGVLLWIQRDEELADLKVELSMRLQGEQENYATLTATNTAPVDSVTVEDEFYFEAAEAKNNIILKLSTSRADININHKIHLISGVLE